MPSQVTMGGDGASRPRFVSTTNSVIPARVSGMTELSRVLRRFAFALAPFGAEAAQRQHEGAEEEDHRGDLFAGEASWALFCHDRLGRFGRLRDDDRSGGGLEA